MRIIKFEKRGAKHGDSGQMIRITKDEAFQLIEGLSSQLRTNSPNVGRAEFIARDGSYFSIAVNEKLEAEE